MLIAQALSTAVQKNPSNIAIKFLKDEMKFGDLRKHVAHFSYLFLKILGPAPRVAFFGSNSSATAVSFFAISNIRGCSIFIDTRWTNEQVAAWLKKSKATHLAVTNDFMPRTRELIRDFRVNLQVIEIEKRHGGEYDDTYSPPPENPPKDTDVILLLPTAGMQGDPKMVTFNHLQLQHAANALKGCYKAVGTDRIMTDLAWSTPFAFMHGMLFPLMNGTTCVVYHGVEEKAFVPFLTEAKITRLCTDPAFAEKLLMRCKTEGVKLPWLKALVVGGSHIPPTLQALGREVKIPVLRVYGQTEGAWTLAMDDFSEAGAEKTEEPVRMKGLPGIKYKVVDLNGDEVEGKEDRTGRLCITGPNIMAGYYLEDPKEALVATKQVVRGTWLYTEDFATINDSGDFLRVDMHGRRGVTLDRGDGTYVAPDCIDPALKDIKGIVDGAGFIFEVSKGKQVLAAGVVRDANPQAVIVKEEDVMNALRKKLAPAQLPSTIVFVEHIPRLVNGLVNRFRLARANAMAAGGQASGAPPAAAAPAGSAPAAPSGNQAPPAAAASGHEHELTQTLS